MFDDNVHIVQNRLIAITRFSTDQLYQAWNASAFNFPASRPLSMLSFGLNHLFTVLDAYSFKLTNLIIHLLCGLILFQITRLAGTLYSRTADIPLSPHQINIWAVAAMALWLVHPINLTAVLYIVQRMASLSTLFILLALWAYLSGRIRLLNDRGGWPLILLATPAFGILAFLCKESGALLPALLFVFEFTLFHFKTATERTTQYLKHYFLIGLVLPFTAAICYLLLQPEWLLIGYTKRPFNLTERLLTESRAVWFYLQMIFGPDNSLLALYHDDFQISRSLLDPPSTLWAMLGVGGLIFIALWQRQHAPILAFGILFFLTGHALESTIIPLELVYEHRNYLPSMGLIITLTYYLLTHPKRDWHCYLGMATATLFIGLCTGKTHIRADEWSNEISMIRAEVAHHPNSPRANFRAGQILISLIQESEDNGTLYPAARQYLEQAIRLNPGNADGLFGLIILHLHLGKAVEPQWLDELKYRLEHIPYDPQNITTGQFSYLVRWHLSDNPKLPAKEVLGIFDAVLHNQALDRYARAAIHASLQTYYLRVLKDPETALEHGYAAVAAWPQQWSYQASLIRLLLEMDETEKAKQQLTQAQAADFNQANREQAQALQHFIQRQQQTLK